MAARLLSTSWYRGAVGAGYKAEHQTLQCTVANGAEPAQYPASQQPPRQDRAGQYNEDHRRCHSGDESLPYGGEAWVSRAVGDVQEGGTEGGGGRGGDVSPIGGGGGVEGIGSMKRCSSATPSLWALPPAPCLRALPPAAQETHHHLPLAPSSLKFLLTAPVPTPCAALLAQLRAWGSRQYEGLGGLPVCALVLLRPHDMPIPPECGRAQT